MNLVVNQPDGSKTPLISREKASAVTKAEQSVGLLGVDTVAITVKTANPLNFTLGGYIDVFGKEYTLNQLPSIKKTGARKFEYNLTFEGVQYELIDAQWLLPADTVLDSFTGDLEDFIDILIGNINRVFPGKWVKGVFPADTEYKTLTFIGSNCLEVAQNLCSEYGIEFEIAQEAGIRTLNFKTAGVNFPYTFRYGRTGGLYELTRQNINSKNVVTRLYVYGGSSNLGSKYRYSKLCLPGESKNGSYIENAAAIAAFGLKENTQTFSEVFPNRIGRVTGAGSKYYAFIDSTMKNFDLNETEADGKTTKWLINGVAGKVKFNTGNLAGYEFEIHKYDHATKEIQVVPFTDENGMKFPSETSAAFQFGVDDEYIFTDINLPDAYKEEAEAKLQEEGETYYNQYCQPQVQYALSIDQNFIKQFGGNLTIVNLFAVGDYIQVEDDDLGVNKSIRITAFTRDLLQPYKYSITLGDAVTKTVITRVIEDLQKIDTVIEINNLADPSKARRNWRAAQEVLANVFDPDGNYYSEKIRPLSIETTMLSVGARSQQFTLQNIRFEPNYNGNANNLQVSAGILIHYTIEETIRSWNINSGSFVFADNTARYIYARAERIGTACSIVIDTAQRAVDSDAMYYYFLVGTLSSIITDSDGSNPARLISLTYGASTINGRFIRTGRIQSSGGGTTYFDLDNGEIGGKINFKDGLVSGEIGIGNEIGVNAGMSGNGNNNDSLRIWAGANAENKENAPFRVYDNGHVELQDVNINSVDSQGNTAAIENGSFLIKASNKSVKTRISQENISGFDASAGSITATINSFERDSIPFISHSGAKEYTGSNEVTLLSYTATKTCYIDIPDIRLYAAVKTAKNAAYPLLTTLASIDVRVSISYLSISVNAHHFPPTFGNNSNYKTIPAERYNLAAGESVIIKASYSFMMSTNYPDAIKEQSQLCSVSMSVTPDSSVVNGQYGAYANNLSSNGFVFSSESGKMMGYINNAAQNAEYFRMQQQDFTLRGTAQTLQFRRTPTAPFVDAFPLAMAVKLTFNSSYNIYSIQPLYNPYNVSIDASRNATGTIKVTHKLGTANVWATGCGIGTDQGCYIWVESVSTTEIVVKTNLDHEQWDKSFILMLWKY